MDHPEAIAKQLIDKLAKDLEDAFGLPKPNRPTMLRYRAGRFESVELADDGNAIEPPPKCPKCTSVLLCLDHMPF